MAIKQVSTEMDWFLLKDSKDEPLWRGTVFRFPAQHPFEDYVDFMLFVDTQSESEFSLVCTTGYKAGHFEASLPKEALASGNVHAIDPAWLLEHWSSHIYVDTDVEKIQYCSGYPKKVGELR